KLVNEKIEIAAFFFRNIGAGHGAKLKLRGEERAKQIGLLMAEAALGEVGDEQSPVVHDERNTHLGFNLAENVADHWIHEKLPNLILNRRNGFAPEPLVIAFILVCPKGADEWV